MKTKLHWILTGLLLICGTTINISAQDTIQIFKDLLTDLKTKSQSVFFQRHYQGIIDVIENKALTAAEKTFVHKTYIAFRNETLALQNEETYVERRFPLIIAWVSPTDGAVSFARIRLPKDWDPEKEYPMYIQLHGLWDVAASAVNFMTYPYRNNPSSSYAYEDGYTLDPWGRGNMWYQGISETDIWEGIQAMKEYCKINPKRQYLTGHSMGGYGTWYIGSRSVGTWAALGLHAAALQYNSSVVTTSVAESFQNTPIYFVVGTNDGLINVNTSTHKMLVNAGIKDVEFVTFTGGHEYVQTNVEKMYDWISQFTNENPTGIKQQLSFSVTKITSGKDISFQIQHLNSTQIEFEVFDITGKKLKTITKQVSGEPVSFIVSSGELKAGVYLYQVNSKSERFTGKFIVR